MCIAALLKPGEVISDDDVHRMFRTNPDGAGLAYVKTISKLQEIVIVKGLFTSEAWLNAIRNAQKSADVDSPILLHARIATQGRVDLDNCHPFRIKDGAMIHNGSLWNGGGRELEKSDTREFAERMFNNFSYDDIEFNKERVESVLTYNKMVLLFKNKKYVILNEKKGEWVRDGLWVSNLAYTRASCLPCSSFNKR